MTTKSVVKSTQVLLPALVISMLQIAVPYKDTELTSQGTHLRTSDFPVTATLTPTNAI